MLRQGKGSHQIWGTPDGKQKLVIPGHREVRAGIVAQVINELPNAPQHWR